MSTTRREVLTLGLGVLGGVVLPRRASATHVHAAQTPAPDQDRMNRPPVDGGERFEPVPGRLFVTPYDNDPFVVGVETKLKCTCGCLHNVYECRSVDFSCSLWPQHHADIVQQATAGWTADEIIAYHLDSYGVEYLMAPAARGFNLVAYLLPGTLIVTVGTLIALYLRRTTQVALVGGPGVDTADLRADNTLSEEDASLLDEELKNLDW